MVGTMPARIQVPITDPTTSRISTAPIEVAMPRLIAPSISAHDWPLARPTSPATAVPSTSAIWLGPNEDSSPNRYTAQPSRAMSRTTGTRAWASEGSTGDAEAVSGMIGS